MRAKAAEAEIAPALRRQLVLAVVEVAGAVGTWRVAVGVDLVDPHRLLLELAEVEEHQLERQLIRPPDARARDESECRGTDRS
jgi:hypothetical protein